MAIFKCLLSLQVKTLYDTYVQKIPKFADETPTYPSWFEPHVMRWFQEYEENSLTFVENAVKADKQEGVSQTAFDMHAYRTF